jgi:type II secretory pathway predicted ATPase ExeA
MSSAYRNFFGFSKEPFSSDIEIKNIIQTPEIKAINDRFDYTVKLGSIALVSGEIGAGKSTALRWIVAQLHPARFRPIWITASSGSILEVYRQILAEFEIKTATSSRATLTRMIKTQISELAQNRKLQPVLVIDEASLLRLEVFAELHTITQFEGDSKPWLPIILIGQNNLADMPTAFHPRVGVRCLFQIKRAVHHWLYLTARNQRPNRLSQILRDPRLRKVTLWA